MRTGRLALFASLLLLAGAAAGSRASAGSDLVPVPDVSGAARADAEATLSGQGFLVAVFDVAGVPAGTVAAESPAAGTALPRGAIVILDVRRAASDSTPAPNAVGLDASEAVLAFGSNYVLKFEPVAGPASSKGKVLAQVPAMGQPLEIRGTLTLRFVPDDALPAKVVVPDTMGLPAADAVRAIGQAGLYARVATAKLSGAPPDVAVAQWPFPGGEVDRYATIDVIVTGPAEGPAEPAEQPPVETPNVVGMTASAARDALDAAGLEPDIEWITGDPSQTFLVQTQDPAPGTPLPPDSPVHLRIVKYTPPAPPPTPPPTAGTSLPSLVGMTLSQAEDVLFSLGLWANPVLVYDAYASPLRVVAQQLAPGTWVEAGAVVTFRVSKPPPPAVPTPVPNFYGRTKAQAVGLAALAGLNLVLSDVLNPAKPANRVFSQSVAAYSVVPVGTTVVLKIAKHPPGPTTTTVPNLNGLTESQALNALFLANLGGSPAWVVAPGKPLFKVYFQWPVPGTTVAGGSLVSFRISKPASGWKTVPDVLGMTKPAASAAILAAGLSPVAGEAFAPGKPVGFVYAENPVAGTHLAAGSPVSFTVAKALVPVVPNVIGKTKLEAEAELSAAGYGHAVLFVASPGQPAGRVWNQVPGAGALAVAGTVVTIRIQPGAPVVAVPNVFGMTSAAANAAISAAGLVPAGTNVFAPGHTLWLVFAQLPGAGFLAPTGSIVHFKVSSPALPPAMVAVPNLTGLSQAGAQAALTAVGLNGDPQLVAGAPHPLGLVYWQSPVAASGVVSGSVVTYRIATFGPPSPTFVAVPNLIGLTGPQATSALLAAGLVSDGSIVLNLLKPAHRVYSQNKSPGTLLASGSTVKWKRNP